MRRARVWAAAFGLLACQEAQPPPAPAVAPDAAVVPDVASLAAAVVPPGAHDALRAAWRESVQYRAAHRALARNRESLARDLDKQRRMLETVEAFQRLPVVSDEAQDAEAVRRMLSDHAKAVGARAEITVETEPAPPMPPTRVSMAEGLSYTPDQIAGLHRVKVRLKEGLLKGPDFVNGLLKLPRYFEIDELAWPAGGVAELDGHVPFFRDLQPVTFFRPPVDGPAIVAQVAGRPLEALTGSERETADKLVENYAQVDALEADLEASLAIQAQLKIQTHRFRVFAEHVERFRKQSWTVLLAGREKGQGKGHGGHGH